MGSIPKSPLITASPKDAVIESGESRRRGSMVRELCMMCDMRPARVPPTATSAALPPIMVAKFVNSRERGRWPRSRA
nr:hypothetical protein Hi04_10k_c1511_00032 [uncultured bacterium]